MAWYSNSQMVGLCATSFALDWPLNTGSVRKKTRWHPFVHYSKCWAVGNMCIEPIK